MPISYCDLGMILYDSVLNNQSLAIFLQSHINAKEFNYFSSCIQMFFQTLVPLFERKNSMFRIIYNYC